MAYDPGMLPLPPSGAPFFSEPASKPAGRPPASAGAQDKVELASARPQPALMSPTAFRKSEPRDPNASPRPYPEPPGSLSKGSACTTLGARGQASGALLTGPLGLALAPALEREAAGPQPRGDACPTGDGWKVPRNPSRTPVRARDPLEVSTELADLGPLRVVSSCSGRIRALRLQWPEEFQDPAFSAQKAVFYDLLTRLPADVTMHVVAEGLAATFVPQLLAEWGIAEPSRVHIHPLHIRSTPDMLYEPMTMWARDGALLTRTQEGREVLLLPRSFRGDGQVDPKLNRLVVQGTGAAPARLGQALPDLVVRRSPLFFEGGDVVASRRTVLIGAQTVARNMEELRQPREAVLELLREQLGLPVVVVDPQPDFHVDLGCSWLDDDTVAVADPGEALRLVGNQPAFEPLVRATQDKRLVERYQSVAGKLSALGFRVTRLPALGGMGLTTPYLTYNNVLIESYPGVKRVYMPVYDVPALDELAREVYRRHGFQVIDMPSALLSTKLWGAIRCATGELIVSDG